MPKIKALIFRTNDWRSVWLIVNSCIVSYLVMCLLFPGLYAFQNFSYIRFSDASLNYEGIFSLISNFYHGGVQLWDDYDQMPLAYQHLVAGVYNFTNITVWAAYVVLHPLFESPAVAFHSILTFFYFMSASVLRAAGAYLLGSLLTRNRWILLSGCVLINTYLIPPFHLGLNTNALFSFFPLLTYFILRFFKDFKLDDLLLAVLTYVLAAATTPLISVSYFYQGIHFVLLPTMIWSLVQNRRRVVKFLRDFRNKNFLLGRRLSENQVKRICLVLLVCFVIILPSAYMLKANYKDYEFDHEHSRFTKMFSVKQYFLRGLYYAPKEEYLWRMVDYTRSYWTFSWVFTGYLTVFLILAGLVLSVDSRKYIFLAAGFLLWLINSPRMSYSWTDTAHWINALTNPFKFAPNTFHMAGALQMCFIFFPLIVIGLEAIRAAVSGQPMKFYRARIILTGVACLAFLAVIYPAVNEEIRTYVIHGTTLGCLLLGLLLFRTSSRQIVGTLSLLIVGILFLLDFRPMFHYCQETYRDLKMISQRMEGLEASGDMNLDFRNPQIYPRRLYFGNVVLGQVKPFLQSDAIGMQGQYYQFTDLYKYFIGIDNYHPRHKSYGAWPGKAKRNQFYRLKDWPGDKEIFLYLTSDSRLMFQARGVVPYQEGLMTRILERQWHRNIALVNDPVPDQTPGVLPQLPTTVLPPVQDELEFKIAHLDLKNSFPDDRGHLMEYQFDLPSDFPKFLATTVFTNDRFLVKVIIIKEKKEFELTPAQGKLIRGLTFDARNMYSDKLVVMLPKDLVPDDEKIHLVYFLRNKNGLTRVWRNEPDNFGFNYNSVVDGWLILHYPYDHRWKFTMDQKPARFYRVNKSFIGLPITKGEHQILMQYWPHTPLRVLIVLSSILYMVMIPIVIGIGIRKSQPVESS